MADKRAQRDLVFHAQNRLAQCGDDAGGGECF